MTIAEIRKHVDYIESRCEDPYEIWHLDSGETIYIPRIQQQAPKTNIDILMDAEQKEREQEERYKQQVKKLYKEQ